MADGYACKMTAVVGNIEGVSNSDGTRTGVKQGVVKVKHDLRKLVAPFKRSVITMQRWPPLVRHWISVNVSEQNWGDK